MTSFFDNKIKYVDGIPIWEYLKKDSKEKEIELTNKDFGKFAEIIGKRITWNFNKSGILKDVFPTIYIKTANRKNLGVGDIGYVISYKNNIDDEDEKYKQKVVIFEVKHGRICIGKYQFEKYCRIIREPEKYFPKADEVKILFLMFDGIDTKNKIANYSMKELDKELLNKYFNNQKEI